MATCKSIAVERSPIDVALEIVDEIAEQLGDLYAVAAAGASHYPAGESAHSLFNVLARDASDVEQVNRLREMIENMRGGLRSRKPD